MEQINHAETSIIQTVLHECSNLFSKVKEVQWLEEKLNKEEVLMSYEKIDPAEYQNALNLERLKDYAMKENT